MWKLGDRILLFCFESAVSFLGIPKSEQDIYVGFAQALHSQCGKGQVLAQFNKLSKANV
jgi:hypothetical protein